MLACWIASSARADVLLVPITQPTQKERSAERLAISLTKQADDAFRLAIAIRPDGQEKFIRADLEVCDQGKPSLAVPIKTTPDRTGSVLEIMLSRRIAAQCHIAVLIDSTDPDRPKTGKLYRIELGSYFPKE